MAVLPVESPSLQKSSESGLQAVRKPIPISPDGLKAGLQTLSSELLRGCETQLQIVARTLASQLPSSKNTRRRFITLVRAASMRAGVVVAAVSFSLASCR